MWRVEHLRGRAAELHTFSAGEASTSDSGRSARLMEVDAPAIVLGGGQPEGHVDRMAAAAAGVDIARRRSGGGAVLVDQHSVVWVDLLLPAGDPLWDTDVGRASWWVGEAWAKALTDVGVGPCEVWKGPLRRTEWSNRVCFAGVGPGEVLVRGVKVVGLSQRRTRSAALFQTAALVRWEASRITALLALGPEERARAERDLADAAGGIGTGAAAGLFQALVDALPR